MITRSHTETMDGAHRALLCQSGNWVHMTGIQPRNLDGDIKAQAQDAIDKLDELLREAGLTQADLFTVTIWLKDMRYFSGLNSVWNQWVDAANPPARTCVSGELYRPDLLLEIVAVAYRPEV
ncbi:RidA family protein [Roseinatronobacter sp. S2]|uniref:RidA family protein n=1 Tax=Roseinatronobacter sp. S2 TaxID=3035471 RepID=UPI002410A7F5|nr:RidA family protein [Roseinatronobacter sp. S2]WFE75695.1 RidA family protein [Roseinatronobacter sp. S2]